MTVVVAGETVARFTCVTDATIFAIAAADVGLYSMTHPGADIDIRDERGDHVEWRNPIDRSSR